MLARSKKRGKLRSLAFEVDMWEACSGGDWSRGARRERTYRKNRMDPCPLTV